MRVEVRDGRSWRSLGQLDVPASDRYDWSSLEVPVSAVGVDDLRLVLVGAVRLTSLRGRA